MTYPKGSFGELEQQHGKEGAMTFLAAQSIKLRGVIADAARDLEMLPVSWAEWSENDRLIVQDVIADLRTALEDPA